jgi:alkanesulfonate monooxygenase SsuD/methylene tetrahydromethanopterin reductase-like flavin-dependent oxidoreductase (luciferase family)
MYGDIFNLDGWARGPMTLEYYYHKLGVLERHCEKVGRDPGEIKHTILMPVMVTDDEKAAADFIAARRLGVGTVAGPRDWVVQRVGEFVDAGVDEIIFGGLKTDKVEQYQQFNEEILKEFD